MIKSEQQIKDMIKDLENLLKNGKTKQKLAFAMGISVLKWVMNEHNFSQLRPLFDIEKDPNGWVKWWKTWGPKGKQI